MMTVKNYSPQDAPGVMQFIGKVQTNAGPTTEILENSVLIKDDNDIVGMVSYVSLDNMGVIRYFLYDARIAGTNLGKSGGEHVSPDKHLEAGLLAQPKCTPQEMTSRGCKPKLDMILELFLELYQKAQLEGIKQLTAQVQNSEIQHLFSMLGFSHVGDGVMLINLSDETFC